MRSMILLSTSLRARATACAAGALVLLGSRLAKAQSCDPFQATCTTTVAPSPPSSGPIEFLVASSGCASIAGRVRTCQDAVTLSPTTTASQKCAAIVAQINAPGSACNLANFTADGSTCATGKLTVTDATCEGQPAVSTGVTLLLANATTSLAGGTLLSDAESDVIANGCQASAGSSLALLAGTATGTAIVGSNSAVAFVVTTPDKGVVSTSVHTTSAMTPSAIVAQVVSSMNGDLLAISSTVRCATDPLEPALASCTPVVSGTGLLGVPVTFQLNDTGMRRFVLSGPAGDIQSARTVIDSQGGIPNLATFQFLHSPAPAPAVGAWGIAGMFFVLGGTGLMLAGGGRRRGDRRAAA
jgi:hypothetical protein